MRLKLGICVAVRYEWVVLGQARDAGQEPGTLLRRAKTPSMSPSQRMNAPKDFEADHDELEDSADIIGIARSIVDGAHPGILATVDEKGNPAVRWMTTLSFEEFPVFYTLTRPDSRKVGQITHHPAVNWMFFNRSRTIVLNLIGKATILTDTPTLKRVWNRVVDKSLPYFMDQYAKGLGFVVIETRVETIECTTPKSSLRYVIQPEEMLDPHYH